MKARVKARVKATGEIVRIEGSGSVFHYGKLLDGYIDVDGVKYLPNELEFDVKEKSFPKDEPDYWDKLHHQAAISAMSAFVIRGCKPEDVAQLSWELAGVMVDKLKNEK